MTRLRGTGEFMFVNTQTSGNGGRSLINLNVIGGFVLSPNDLQILSTNVLIASASSAEALAERYNDICDALTSGNVVIYDADKACGYWKAADTSKRTLPKKKATPPEA